MQAFYLARISFANLQKKSAQKNIFNNKNFCGNDKKKGRIVIRPNHCYLCLFFFDLFALASPCN